MRAQYERFAGRQGLQHLIAAPVTIDHLRTAAAALMLGCLRLFTTSREEGRAERESEAGKGPKRRQQTRRGWG
jgi:hypothetical protein